MTLQIQSNVPRPSMLVINPIVVAEILFRGSKCRSEPRGTVPPQLKKHPNLSLLWHRYMPAHDREPDFGIEVPASPRGDAAAEKPFNKARDSTLNEWKSSGVLSWFARVAKGASCPEYLKLKERYLKTVRSTGPTVVIRVSAPWRVAIGLGNACVLENAGLTLHHTYGFPYLPGSALKGVARHYFVEEFAPDHTPGRYTPSRTWRPNASAATQQLLFGNAAGEKARAGGEGAEESEGTVIFEDAWPEPLDGGWFESDVLAVHHPKYYRGARANADDTENVNLIHFPVLRPGVQFDIPLALCSAARRHEPAVQRHLLWLAGAVLTQALGQWGIGAKTGAGYGRLTVLAGEESGPAG